MALQASEREPLARMSAGYPLRQLERAIKDLQPVFAVTEARHLLIDLGGLVHIAPSSFALLVAALKRLSMLG